MKTAALIAITGVCAAASVSSKGDILNALRQYAASQVDAASKATCDWKGMERKMGFLLMFANLGIGKACVNSAAGTSRPCREAANAEPSQRRYLYIEFYTC